MTTTKSYYGPFFWLAAISFVVPLVVAAKAISTAPLVSRPTSHPDASGVDHGLWDFLLKSYVENGLIDYDGLGRDHLFRVYVRQLAEADPTKLTTSADELALLCNAYNAFVMNGVITHRIRDSVMSHEHEGKQFFDIPEHIFAGQTISLNDIEHTLIRKRFKEPRVHVALVCAARSCPAIRPEAYVGKRLASQLEDQSRQFANSPTYVLHDAAESVLRLSAILDWYGDDWKHQGGYLKWLEESVEDADLRNAIEQAGRNELPIAFFDYDWSLNAQVEGQAAAGQAPRKAAEFGSGSVPNE